MALRKIFCPNCGQQTQINEEKAFCFCLQCGNKIVLKAKTVDEETALQMNAEKSNPEPDYKQEADPVARKLEEVAFYYKLSQDKKEYENYSAEPMYYLKAQDILVDLSEQYPDDYRIWWELCKPVDYENPLSGNDSYDQYRINEDYFGKALDRAELAKKSELIQAHDRYVETKKIAKVEAESRQREEEAKKQQEYEAEQRRKKEEQEAFLVAQEQKKREEEEQLKKEKEAGITQSRELWTALKNKDYSAIDNSFFSFSIENNQKVIGVFKVMSNMLYLMAFRIDGNKANTIYRDQTISIKFDEKGHGMKFDNTPVRTKGLVPPSDALWIVLDGKGRLQVNDMPLSFDAKYVADIIKRAKKPLLSFAKVFI